jgi:hypothetical protein
MWEHPGSWGSVQQDEVSKCGQLECHGLIWTYEMQARAESTGTILTNATGGLLDSVTLVAVLNACVSTVALEEDRCVHEHAREAHKHFEWICEKGV